MLAHVQKFPEILPEKYLSWIKYTDKEYKFKLYTELYS